MIWGYHHFRKHPYSGYTYYHTSYVRVLGHGIPTKIPWRKNVFLKNKHNWNWNVESFYFNQKNSWVLLNLYEYPNFNPIFTQTTPGSFKKKGTNPNFNGLLQREIPQNCPIKMCIKFDPPQHGPSWWLNQPIWANMRQSNWVHLSPIFGDEKQKIWMKPSTRVPWLMTPNLFTQNPTPTLPPSPNFPPV